MASIRDQIVIRPYTKDLYPAHGLGRDGIYYTYVELVKGTEEQLKDKIYEILVDALSDNLPPEHVLCGDVGPDIEVQHFNRVRIDEVTHKCFNMVQVLQGKHCLVGCQFAFQGAIASLWDRRLGVHEWVKQFDEFKPRKE